MPDGTRLIKTALLVILVVFAVFGVGIALVHFLWNPGPKIVVEGATSLRSFHLPPEYGESALAFKQTIRTTAFLDEIRQCCKDYPELMRTWTSETVKITIGIEPLGSDKVYVSYTVPVFSLRYTTMDGFFNFTEYHTGKAPQFPEVSMEANKRNEEILKRVEEFLRQKIEESARTM